MMLAVTNTLDSRIAEDPEYAELRSELRIW